MPALTPGQLPYPTGSDKLVDGDDQIKALALAADPALLLAVGPAADIGVSTAWTTILFSSVLARGVTYNPATGLATIVAAGVYECFASGVWNAAASGDRLFRITLNGVADPTNSIVTEAVVAVSTLRRTSVSRTLALAVNDVLRVQAFSGTAASIRGSNNVGMEPRFTVRRVAP